jgi:hypothetical protein
MNGQRKKALNSFKRLIQYLGFAFLIWLFGLLVFIPLSDLIPFVQSFVGFILLVPISILYFRVIWDMKDISQIVGNSLSQKFGRTGFKKPYVHLCYAFWIIITIIFFTPLIFFINKIIGGLFLFIAISCLIFLVFINLKFIIALILRYIS